MDTQDTTKPDWIDTKGRKVPDELVKPMDKLKEQTIGKILGHATELSDQIARFKNHTFDDMYALQELLKADYGAPLGGAKGNIDLVSFDGLRKVQISIADHVTFGPELVVAKELIDAYIEGEIAGASASIRALVTHAFETDKPGHVNREGLLSLRRMDIQDDKWKRAMDAIGDSMRVTGSKAYVRVYQRDDVSDPWKIVPLNIAAV